MQNYSSFKVAQYDIIEFNLIYLFS